MSGQADSEEIITRPDIGFSFHGLLEYAGTNSRAINTSHTKLTSLQKKASES